MHILFICTGNICRSPTAERLTAAYAARLKLQSVTVSSAGIRAVVGHPMHPDAQPVLAGLGGDPANFAAAQFTPKIAERADLILTMTRAHRESVLERAPQKLHRTFTLSEAAQLVDTFNARCVADLANLRAFLHATQVADIPDPIGQSPEIFAAVGAQIAKLLPPVLELCRPE
ncbi:protein tyrosine phosphatase [Mycobacterium adipatum]|uniref:Protein tyrosine phosphatase n=1 Tax=Mycobacterium adipatum TaxID=1682113 RepID=A0A172UWD4_9MYCO|nr:protein tyrosine phosphatase [Mycobacterium adipatum]ANE83278.1 protein tyrosine phosphatase [Mycobacterium adipatum]